MNSMNVVRRKEVGFIRKYDFFQYCFLLCMNILGFICLCKSAAAFAHLIIMAPDQLHFSIGSALELEFSSWPSPA